MGGSTASRWQTLGSVWSACATQRTEKEQSMGIQLLGEIRPKKTGVINKEAAIKSSFISQHDTKTGFTELQVERFKFIISLESGGSVRKGSLRVYIKWSDRGKRQDLQRKRNISDTTIFHQEPPPPHHDLESQSVCTGTVCVLAAAVEHSASRYDCPLLKPPNSPLPLHSKLGYIWKWEHECKILALLGQWALKSV